MISLSSNLQSFSGAAFISIISYLQFHIYNFTAEISVITHLVLKSSWYLAFNRIGTLPDFIFIFDWSYLRNEKYYWTSTIATILVLMRIFTQNFLVLCINVNNRSANLFSGNFQILPLIFLLLLILVMMIEGGWSCLGDDDDWRVSHRIGASPGELHFLQDSSLIPNSNKRMKTKLKLKLSTESMEGTKWIRSP